MIIGKRRDAISYEKYFSCNAWIQNENTTQKKSITTYTMIEIGKSPNKWDNEQNIPWTWSDWLFHPQDFPFNSLEKLYWTHFIAESKGGTACHEKLWEVPKLTKIQINIGKLRNMFLRIIIC